MVDWFRGDPHGLEKADRYVFLAAAKKPQESVRTAYETRGERVRASERASERERERKGGKMGDEVFEANVNLGCMQRTMQPHFIRRLLPRISSNHTGDSLRNEDIYTRAQIGSRWALLVITHRSLHFSLGRPLRLLLSILVLCAHLSRDALSYHQDSFLFKKRERNIFLTITICTIRLNQTALRKIFN